MQNIGQILEFLREKDTNIKEISNETGIPSDRLYSWRQNRGTPKADDSAKLLEWARKKFQPTFGPEVIQKEKQFEQDYKDKYITLLEEHNREMKDRIKSLLQINADLKTEVKSNLDTVLGNQLVLTCLFDSYVKHFASVIIHGDLEQQIFCSDLHKAAFELVKDVSRMGSHLSIGSEGIVSNGNS